MRPRSAAAGAATPPGPTTSTTRCASLLTGERERLLRGVRRRVAAARQGVPPPARPRRRLLDVPPPALRRAGRRPPRRALRRLRPEPRPGRQPRVRRPAARPRSARSPRSARCCRPFMPMLFMGEEYGERAPFQFFTDHIDEEIADRHPRGPPARVRRLRRVRRRGGARPAGPGDVRALEAHARRATPALRDALRASCSRCAASCRAGDADDVDFDEDAPLAARAPRAVHARRELRREPRRVPVDGASSSSSPPTTATRRPTARVACRAAAPASAASDERARSGPGGRSRSAPTWDGAGHELLAVLRERRARRAVPVRRRRRRGARRGRRAHRAQLALLPARRRARASATATASTAPTSPSEGHRFNPAKLLIDPYAKAIEGAGRLGRGQRRCPTCPTAPTTPTSSSTTRTTPTAIPKSRRRRRALRLGGRPRRRARRGTRRSSTRRTSRASRSATRTCREDLRGTYAGLASDAGARLPEATSASPRSSCCRSTTSPTSSFLHEQGPDELLGLQLDRLPRAARRATPRPARRGEQVREFKGMVKALHRAGIEVILDVVYNHTAEGNHLGPMLSFKGVDNASLLPAGARRPALLHGLHGHGQHAQRRRTRASCG